MNSPVYFQTALEIIFAQQKKKNCLVYLDDIIVFSDSVEDHFKHDDLKFTAYKRKVSLRRSTSDTSSPEQSSTLDMLSDQEK